MTFDELERTLQAEGLDAAIAFAAHHQAQDVCRVLKFAGETLRHDPAQLAAQLALRLDTPIGKEAAQRCRLRPVAPLPIDSSLLFTGHATFGAIKAMLTLSPELLLTASNRGDINAWWSQILQHKPWQLFRTDELGCAINTAALDEKHVLVGMDDGTAIVFDRSYLKERVRLTLRGRIRSVALHRGVCFLGTDEGEFLAACAVTGEARFRIEGAHPAIFCVAVAEDGRTIATSGSDNAIRIWDAESGALVRTLYDSKGDIAWVGTLYINTPNETGIGHRNPCHHLLTMPNGGWLSLDNEVIHWSHEGEVLNRTAIAWAPNDVARRGDHIAILTNGWFQVLDNDLEFCWGKTLEGSGSAITWLEDKKVAVGFRSGDFQIFTKTDQNSVMHHPFPSSVVVRDKHVVVSDSDGGATLITPSFEKCKLGDLPTISRAPQISVGDQGHSAVASERQLHFYSQSGKRTVSLDVGTAISVLHHLGEQDVIVGTVKGPLLRAVNGELSELRAGPEHTVDIAYHDGLLFVVMRETAGGIFHRLRCIRLVTAEVLWTVDGIDPKDSDIPRIRFGIAPIMVADDGRLFTGSGHSDAYVERDPRTGAELRSWDFEGRLLCATIVDESVRFVTKIKPEMALLCIATDEGCKSFELGPTQSAAFFKGGLAWTSALDLNAWSHDRTKRERIEMLPLRLGASPDSKRCVVVTSEGIIVFLAEMDS